MENIPNNMALPKQRFSFKKEERLRSKKIISQLFLTGESIKTYPIKIVFLETSHEQVFSVQSAFSVGKKSFKKAVQRNLLKRRMRESFRLNKENLYQTLKDKKLAVFFIYTGKEILDYQTIDKAVKKTLEKLAKHVTKN